MSLISSQNIIPDIAKISDLNSNLIHTSDKSFSGTSQRDVLSQALNSIKGTTGKHFINVTWAGHWTSTLIATVHSSTRITFICVPQPQNSVNMMYIGAMEGTTFYFYYLTGTSF